jgi:hypothetical protein
LEEDGRIEYEVKWENDEVLTWEPADMFTGGGTEILKEFQSADEELQRALVVEKEKEKGNMRPRKRRRKQAWVMEVEDGVADYTVFEADDWKD